MIKASITVQNKLYGPSVYKGYKTCEASPFVVYRTGPQGIWTIGHQATGLGLGSLIPHSTPRTKYSLWCLIESIEWAKPDEVKIVAAVEDENLTPSHQEALRAIRAFTHS